MERLTRMPNSLSALVPESWKPVVADALAAPTFATLEQFLEGEWKSATIFPPRESIFAALARTAPDDVKVLLLGQDPYPRAGDANGLSFSVSPGVKLPGSLRNLFKGLAADVGAPTPSSGDLSTWADRGVLLLNCVLTVREGEANSHQKRGWEPFTQAIVSSLATRPVIFLCLGKPAEKLVTKLVPDAAARIVTAPHPSPLNGNAFVDAATKDKPFSRVNALLTAAGRTPIDWSLA